MADVSALFNLILTPESRHSRLILSIIDDSLGEVGGGCQAWRLCHNYELAIVV
jgi:hypothetical protein